MDITPREQSIVRRLDESKRNGVSQLLRSSIYCAALAAMFLYLALSRNQPLYSIGIFGMFILYLAIRVYSARRIAGIMPRILQQYEIHISELEARLRKIEAEKERPTS